MHVIQSLEEALAHPWPEGVSVRDLESIAEEAPCKGLTPYSLADISDDWKISTHVIRDLAALSPSLRIVPNVGDDRRDCLEFIDDE